MPSLDTIRTLTIKATQDGVDDVTKSLNDLATAQGGVATASDTTSKSTLSAASALNKLQNSLDPNYRATTQLSAAQTTLGKAWEQGLLSADKYTQLMALASQRFDDASKKASPFATALSGVKSQLIGLSAGLGPVGTTLAALGPIGLAAGAGLAVIGEALSAIKNQADEAGQWAQSLQQAASITDFNTTSLQALNTAAADVSVSAGDNVSAIEKFNVALGQLKGGSGTLYLELLKVNPALVAQLSVTKDNATAWNLLAQAYASASAQQQTLITRAAFGRGGAAEGQVLGATANAGGIGGLVGNNAADSIAPQQIALWAQLTTQINSATEAAQRNFQNIFTTNVLTSEKNYADGMLSISRSAREFAMSDDLKKYITFFTNPIVAGTIGGALVGAVGGALFGGIGAIPGAIAGGIAGGVAGATVNGVSNIGASQASQGQPLLTGAAGLKQSGYNPDQSDFVAASLGVQAAQASQAVSFLGSAATATDKYNASVAKLNLEVANNSNLTGLQARALAGLSLDKLISEQSSYVSALGEFATTQDKATQASLNFQKTQLTNPRLTDDQRAAVVALTVANDEWTRASNQAQLGVFDLSAATKAANDQFKAQQAPGGLLSGVSADQAAAAMQAYSNKITALGDAAKVAGSATPQLTQLALDAGNANKQFDSFATTSLNDFSDALVSIGTGASTAGAAFQNFGLQVLAALEKMIVQLTIVKPLAAAVESSFGGAGSFLSALGIGSPGQPLSLAAPGAGLTSGVDVTDGLAAIHHTGGIVGGDSMPMRYINPAYFDDAPRFHTGGIAGDEVPIIAKAGEGVFTPGQMAAMGGGGQPSMSFTYAPTIDARGQDPQVVARLAVAQANDRKSFKANVIAVMSQYKANNPGGR